MKIRVTNDPAEFKAIAFPFLQSDPVLNSYILSNTEDRINGILHDPAPPVFLSIHDDTGDVLGAVFCTAPRRRLPGAVRQCIRNSLGERLPRRVDGRCGGCVCMAIRALSSGRHAAPPESTAPSPPLLAVAELDPAVGAGYLD
ncbi:hypothetical protein [Kribbella sp. NPDC051718]|uniref:hypothetical protein n=1 Tax=Kribbella sp. NPDC051718 TaxID=3155168 RepID=UPI003442127C